MKTIPSHMIVSFRCNVYRFVLTAVTMIACAGCSGTKDRAARDGEQVVVAIEGDVDSFNPLFAEDVTAGEINDLLFPGLLSVKFKSADGTKEYGPLLASSWEYENGNRDIRFHLRTDASWSDGARITSRDVRLSYTLYGDTAVASVRQTSVEGLRRTPDGRPDVARAIETVDDSTVIFHFDHPYAGQLFDAGLPILPAHIFENLPRTGLRDGTTGRQPVGAGPFLLKVWKPMEEVRLVPNGTSRLPHPGKLSEVIFRVVPDYHSRLMQLRSGEIDVFPYVNVDDALELAKAAPQFEIVSLGERFYDAINWNNIDPLEYDRSHGKHIQPHPLFGSAKVRRALTLSINRKEIVDTYLHSYGRECIGPVSPLFRWAYNDSLPPLPFDPKKASELLREEGWRDTDGDGVLDRNGTKFSFTLKVPAGNQLRATIATIVQRALRTMGAEMKIEQVERSAFWNAVGGKQFDACIAGFSVPLQMQLDEMWGSDLERSRFNIPSFRNRRADEILAGARRVARETDYAASWKEFQALLQREQPCTFLYWLNDLVAVNKRVRGTNMGILGIAYRAEEWHTEPVVASGR